MNYAEYKLNAAIRLAKLDSAYYRETKDKRFIQLRKEAMNDARYWKTQLTA